MELHKLLLRQLKRAGLDPTAPPVTEQAWLKFLDIISNTYQQTDLDRYLQEQSIGIVTSEMNDLNEKFNLVQQIGHLGYWQFNLKNNSSIWSKEIYRMVGIKVGMAIPKLEEIFKIIHADDLPLVKKSIENTKNKKNFKIEIRMKKFDVESKYRWYYLMGQPQCTDDNIVSVIHFIIMDIQHHKENEEKILKLQKNIVESEKMAVLGQLSAGIAHEINNPLTFTLSNMSSLERRLDFILHLLDLYQTLTNTIQNVKPKELLDLHKTILHYTDNKNMTDLMQDIKNIIQESTDGLLRIKNIILSVRSFSAVESHSMELMNLNDCIRSSIEMVSNDVKHKCEIQSDLMETPLIMGSPTLLMMVFVNLLLNAVEAVQNKGTVKISSRVNKTSVLISISDNGCGISSADVSKLFTPFYTTKEVGAGAGLGLAASYGIIKLHRGKITIESEVDKGSIFTIELPLYQESEYKILDRRQK